MFVAENITQFKKLFVSKLSSMLTEDELGAFILVLANSQQDEALQSALNNNLEKFFIVIKKNLKAIRLSSTQDDIDVFEKLIDTSLNDIPLWQTKTIDHWELSYNAMRQLRPARASSDSFNSIKQAFDESRFHFNKPFLKPEILWEGEYSGCSLRVLYNKFPFSDYHLLLAVSPEEKCPQLLTQEAHKTICSLVKNQEKIFSGFGVGFNSVAAGASVNHLHFQGFLRERMFPIEADCWQHNGGEVAYPLQVRRFLNADSSWEYIDQLTTKDTAFNCLYLKNICYVIPRKYQGTVDLPGWLEGAGWLDVAGVMTVSDENTFNSIDEQSVTSALRSLAN